MTTLLLVRHGLTAQTGRVLYGQTRGIGLDDRGLAQAEQLARRLAPLRPTAIYSSPLERCVETVQPLAAACRLTVVERDDLIEMHAGSWTGKPLARLRRTKAWGEVQQRPEAFRFPGGGESFEEARDRAVAELHAIARRHRRGRVVVATHGDILRVVLTDLAGAPLARFQRIVVDTASVSVATIDGGGPRVLLVNDTGDLRRFAPGGGTTAWEAPRSGEPRPGGNLRG
jgi:probable phosphomutase (TIGR03848 family)